MSWKTLDQLSKATDVAQETRVETADKVEWVERSVRGDLWQKDSKSEGLQDESETCFNVWFGDSATV